MRAVVDLEALRVRNCGLGQFSLSLGRALLEEAGDDVQLAYFLRRGECEYFAHDGVELAVATTLRRETYCQALRPLLRMFLSEPCDVWHMSNQNAKFWPLDPRTPMVLTIHDLNFLRERDPRETPHELRKLQAKVDRATAIATDSKFVEQEIREHLNVGNKEIDVIYCGVNLESNDIAARPAFLPPGQFLFTIGEVVPKKNFHVLLDLVEELPQYRLVIAGSKTSDYARQIEADVQQRGLKSQVFLPGQISGGERLWLYQNCEAFLFPSRTEGFGIPVIEAMSAGRPIFLSHATSLPEVAGPLGFYWHAYDQPHLLKVFREGMDRFRCTPHYSQQLQAHAAQFTWQRAARQYLALYRRTAEQSQRRKLAA
jgi:glycosyltransferase involved in cell wall biosynthesis